ncbi:hypothetical protein ACWED2_42410 [Amycolatopsis sp. NPDC005003]
MCAHDRARRARAAAEQHTDRLQNGLLALVLLLAVVAVPLAASIGSDSGWRR